MHGRGQLTPVLSVGGITIGIQGCSAHAVPPGSRPFLVDEPAPEVLCSGRLGEVGSDASYRPVFDSGGVWRIDEAPGGGIRLVLRAGRHPGRPYHAIELNPELDRGAVTLDPSQLRDEPEPFLLRAPLHELWTQFLLLRGRGVLVHGCALLTENGVYLFVGPSGAGKSTLAAILEDRYGTVLSDDRVIVRAEGAGFCAYGTPWHGEARFASPKSGPLREIHFLGHGARTLRSPQTSKEAAARLSACCFMAGWPPLGIKDLLRTCVGIVKSVPCHKLSFLPDESAARAAGLEPAA